MTIEANTPTFILVHGAWAGAWVWENISPKLKSAGYSVITIDLPGKGSDTTPPADISLAVYVQYLCGVIDSVVGDIILVGHSGAGLTISQTAEYRSKRVIDLVYIAGFLLPSGMSFGEFSALYHPKNDTRLTASHLAINSSDGLTSSIRPGDAIKLFFNRANPQSANLAAKKLAPEPISGKEVGASLSNAKFGKIRKSYIECIDDQTIVLAIQRKMQELTPCQKTYRLNSDHAPQLSAPDELIEALLDIGAPV